MTAGRRAAPARRVGSLLTVLLLLLAAPQASPAAPGPEPAVPAPESAAPASPVGLQSLTGRVVREVVVEAPAIALRSADERDYMGSLLGLRAGDRLTRAAIRSGIERVYRTGKWQTLAVTGTPVADDGVVVRLVLEPIERIGLVRFDGPRIVTRGDLENVIRLRAGEAYRPETVARATRAIQDHLDTIGYPDAVVVATSRPFGEPLERELTISITPNEPCQIAEVRFQGALGPGEAVLREAFRLERGDVCSRPRIDEGTERVRAALRERGYLEAVVSRPQVAVDREKRRASITVPVRAGERTDLVFERVTPGGAAPERVGGCRWWDRLPGPDCEYAELVAALDLGEQPDFSPEGLSFLSDRLVEHLRADGYAWAAVSARAVETESGRQVVFRIDQGPPLRVRGVEFLGNTEVSEADLLDQMVTRRRTTFGFLAAGAFLQSEFDEDLDAIETYYRRQGFLDARITEVDFRYNDARDRMWITITVSEGPRYFVTDVEVQGADPIPPDVVARDLPLKAGQPFSLAAVDGAREWLVEALAARGYLSPAVVPDVDLETSPPEARVRFTVTPGLRTLVGRIIYRGNFFTQTSVLEREMTVEPGDPYDPTRVLESQRNIGRVGFLRNVSVRPVDEAPGTGAAPVPAGSPAPGAVEMPDHAVEIPDHAAPAGPVSRDLLVSVEEANRVDLGFGADYSLEERLRVFGDVTFRNLYGSDRSVTLRGIAGSRESLYGIDYLQPYVFGFRLDGRVGLIYQDREEENFSFRRRAITTSVQRNLTRSVRVSLAYEFESTETYDVEPGTVIDPREDVGTVRIGALRPVVVWDRRDDPFNPTRGFLNTLSVEVANQAFLSESEFVRVIAGTSWYLPLERTRRLVIALSLRGGYAASYGASTEVPLIRRFFLGGANSVRGFDLDSISPKAPDGTETGGNISINENVELRYPLPFGFAGALFFDAGQVWLDETDVDLGDQRTSVGLGLRYVTPVGPIRLDYGYKLDREPGESIGELHFSIGYVF